MRNVKKYGNGGGSTMGAGDGDINGGSVLDPMMYGGSNSKKK